MAPRPIGCTGTPGRRTGVKSRSTSVLVIIARRGYRSGVEGEEAVDRQLGHQGVAAVPARGAVDGQVLDGDGVGGEQAADGGDGVVLEAPVPAGRGHDQPVGVLVGDLEAAGDGEPGGEARPVLVEQGPAGGAEAGGGPGPQEGG